MTTMPVLDLTLLRGAIQDEYAEVAVCPVKGFHFHVGRPLAARLGYPAERIAALPDAVVERASPASATPSPGARSPRARRRSIWGPAPVWTPSWPPRWLDPAGG